jgi:hypothetical protein
LVLLCPFLTISKGRNRLSNSSKSLCSILKPRR